MNYLQMAEDEEIFIFRFTPELREVIHGNILHLTSSGSVGGIVAAPEPVSAILFVTGGASIGF